MNTQTLTQALSSPLSSPLPVTAPAGAGRWRARAAILHAALGLLAPLALLGLWQLAHSLEWIPVQILPSPQRTWQTFWELYEGGELRANLLISLERVAWSVLAGGLSGLALGFAIGLSPRARAYLYPSFEVFAQFPVIGWIPLLMLFLGIDEALKIVAISLAVAVPVVVNTYKGILDIPGTLLEVGRVYRFSARQSLLRVVIPAASPAIFGGIRQGVMQAWLLLIFVELLASSEGLGFLMIWARQVMQLDIVFVAIVLIGVIGYLLDWALRQVEDHFNAWQPKGR
ncbi:MAG: ABC transporter permease [Azoarcus sp.]|jgi:sulfonate transport system permease protein|nr:ABC transporter permease [Azoarcus sp.]